MFDESLKRQDGESIEEYQMRLSVMKLKEGYDIDWFEIKELLRSDEHVDTLRRKGYGLAMAYEIYEDKINKMTEDYYLQVQQIRDRAEGEIEDKRLTELQNKVLQLKIEKEKLKNERNHVNAQVRVVARIEHFIECLKDDIIKFEKKERLVIDKDENKLGRDGVILLSDLHMGAETDNILDCYNPMILEEKLKYYIKMVLLYAKEQNIEDMYFLIAGDLISGIIHNVNRFDSRLDVSQQVIRVAYLLSDVINEVSEQYNVKVVITNGNHDRIIADKNNHIEEENFTTFINEILRLKLSDNERVEFLPCDDCTLSRFEIRGNKCALVHGNNDKRNTINRLVELDKTVFDFIFSGHWHKAEQWEHNHTTIIVNGAFGGEGYARNARLYNKPIQKFMIFTEEGMMCSYDINLNNYKK